MTDRTLSYVPLTGLKADPANPKTHSLDTIGQSIDRFGYVEPIVVDQRTGYTISGHGRTQSLRDARERGDAPPDGVQVGEGGEWLVPVVTGWASRSDAEARGALIALNRSGELGGWDDRALLDILDRLAEESTLDGIGYDDQDLRDLRKLLADSPDLDSVADGWDGSGMDPRPLEEAITLSDPDVIADWRHHRADFPSDNLALAALMTGEQ